MPNFTHIRNNVVSFLFLLFFGWLLYLFIQGWFIGGEEDEELNKRNSYILGFWKNCKQDTCCNLQFYNGTTCAYILTSPTDSIYIPAKYGIYNSYTTIKGRRGKSIGKSLINDKLIITLDTLRSKYSFATYEYTIDYLDEDTLKLYNAAQNIAQKFFKLK
jgi:hypothetical protein